MTYPIFVNALGEQEIQACLDKYRLNWCLVATINEIETMADSIGANFVKDFGLEWLVGSISGSGEIQRIRLGPECFEF